METELLEPASPDGWQSDDDKTLREVTTIADAAPQDASNPDPAVAHMRNQLEKELLKRRPDRFVIAVTCRSLGGVPSTLRVSIWKELLGVAHLAMDTQLEEAIAKVDQDLENQRVIAADATRTRAHDAFFRKPETVEAITKILTYYCKTRSVEYKQGMNEVLAPFLMLEREAPLAEGVVYQLFYAMIDKYLPHVFVDREFKSLQCSLQLFRLLMLYHDPMLCNFLDQHAMTPELYLTPWFMTLFARSLSSELVFVLWDFFLLHEDPYLLHFVAYTLVEAHRDEILAAHASNLPQVLTGISFESAVQMDTICRAALQLTELTPRSFKRDLYSVCYGDFNDAMLPFLTQLMSSSSLHVYPDELIENLMNRLGRSGAAAAAANATMAASGALGGPVTGVAPAVARMRARKTFSVEMHASMRSVYFIVLDCRPIEQFDECHLSLSYHVDPEVVGSPDALSTLIKGFSRMKGCHFCFLGPSPPSAMSSRSGSAFGALAKLARGKGTPTDSLNSPASVASESSEPSSNGETLLPHLSEEHISVTRLLLMFLQKGFEHVCRLDGGFDVLRKQIESMDKQTQDQLLVFAENSVPSAVPASTGGLKTFARRAMQRVRTFSDEASSMVVGGQQVSETPPSVNTKAKSKSSVTTFSHKLQAFTNTAKGAVSSSRGSNGRSRLTSTDEHGIDGEEEWIEVCMRTRDALEKSRHIKDVCFVEGSLGLLLQRSRQKRYLAAVDSLVPDSQASESQQVEVGDLLVAINGRDVAGVEFSKVIEMVKDATRPLVLRFETPSKKSPKAVDAIAMPPMPPIMISATAHTLCISWNKLSVPNARYQLQYARHVELQFNPWLAVPIKKEGTSELEHTGITVQTIGTLVGLEPGTSVVFRVRCGNSEKWGPYSLSSGPMHTMDPEDTTDVTEPSSDGSPPCVDEGTLPRLDSAVFLPGECPETVESGTFFYRVVAGLRARKTPEFNGERLDIVLEKGMIIKCNQRLVLPSSNQVFARLCSDWDLAAHRSEDASKDSGPVPTEPQPVDGDEGVWAFENTPEGVIVLERLPLFSEDEYLPPTPTRVSVQAKSLMSSIFSASGIKGSSTPNGHPDADPANALLSTPRIVQVSAVSAKEIAVKWDTIDTSIVKYQVQYAKKGRTTRWANVKQDLDGDTHEFTVVNLAPNTSYVFRVRGGNDDHWGQYSDVSHSCKTLDEESAATTDEEAADDDGAGRPSRPTMLKSLFNGVPVGRASLSTFRGKAVAAASKLTKRRTPSGNIIMHDSSSDAASDWSEHSDDYLDLHPKEGDLVDVGMWKAELEMREPSSEWFSCVRFLAMREDGDDDEEDTEDRSSLTWQRVGERHLVITKTTLYVLAMPSAQVGAEGLVETSRPLASLSRITSKAAVANSIVFHFRTGERSADATDDDSENEEQLCFAVDYKNECVALVKRNFAVPDAS